MTPPTNHPSSRFGRSMTLSAVAAASLALVATAAHSAVMSKDAATPSATAPVVVLVPVTVVNTDKFANGCWARLYDSTDFKGDQLTVVGPAAMPDMTSHWDVNWAGTFDSVVTGPNAQLTVYDNENYKDKAKVFKSGQRVADLDEKMGFFESVKSVKVNCQPTVALAAITVATAAPNPANAASASANRRSGDAKTLAAMGAGKMQTDLGPEIQTQGDVKYVMGGVSNDGKAQTQALGDDMSLKLVFAVKETGAYLSNLDVAIADQSGNTVLELDSSNPLLFVELPAGTYDVTAVTQDGETIKRAVTVAGQGQTTERFLWSASKVVGATTR